jgi:hypothetical protein
MVAMLICGMTIALAWVPLDKTFHTAHPVFSHCSSSFGAELSGKPATRQASNFQSLRDRAPVEISNLLRAGAAVTCVFSDANFYGGNFRL